MGCPRSHLVLFPCSLNVLVIETDCLKVCAAVSHAHSFLHCHLFLHFQSFLHLPHPCQTRTSNSCTMVACRCWRCHAMCPHSVFEEALAKSHPCACMQRPSAHKVNRHPRDLPVKGSNKLAWQNTVCVLLRSRKKKTSGSLISLVLQVCAPIFVTTIVLENVNDEECKSIASSGCLSRPTCSTSLWIGQADKVYLGDA